jgi:hypothetical protein
VRSQQIRTHGTHICFVWLRHSGRE